MRDCDRPPRRYRKLNRNLWALCDLRLKGAINHTDWIRAEKDGTFDALVRRKCGREDSDARLLLKYHVRFGSIVLKKSVPEAGLVWLGR